MIRRQVLRVRAGAAGTAVDAVAAADDDAWTRQINRVG